MAARRQGLAAVGLTVVVAFAIAVLAPRRQISGDTVPGRLGALVLRCGGGFDLGRVDWIAAAARGEHLPYWAQLDGDGAVVSVFGPAPAVIGAVALLDVGPGDTIDDAQLRARERLVAALAIALAAGLLAAATLARHGAARSLVVGLLAAGSFAGAATLGQGLWQQSIALPWLVGALAALAWRERAPRIALVTPALLVVAVLIRPTIAPLALGLGVLWCAGAGRGVRTWSVAAALALAAAVPFLMWNLAHFGTPLPVGQWRSNARVAEHVFVLSRAQLGYGLGGLLISPGRGVLWFAPIAIVGVVLALRDRVHRIVAAAVAVQLLVIALFHMWWGGVCYGPRFLAEATWVGIWLALGSDVALASRPRRVVGLLAAGVTLVVGQLGLWGWRAEQWESRRNVDVDQNAVWDFVDSPIAATLTDPDDQLTALDAPQEAPRMRCEASGIVGVER